MSLNVGTIQVRLPFDFEVKGEGSKAVVMFTGACRRNYKPEGAQYYPEDLITFKAFGSNAEFIGKYFKKGDDILIQYELRRDNDYEKDGQTVKGQMYAHVVSQYFVGKAENGNSESAQPKLQAATGSKPALGGAKPALGGGKPALKKVGGGTSAKPGSF